MAPLFWCVVHLRWKSALFSSFVFGSAFVATLVWWVSLFGFLPLVALSGLTGLIYFSGFASLARILGARCGSWSRLLLLPGLWVVVEWLSSLWITGFPWWGIGYSQHRVLPVIQIASVTGVWGVSFVLALVNALAANAMHAWGKPRELRALRAQALTVAAIVGATGVWGAVRLVSPEAAGRPLRAAVIQGNIAQNVPHDRAYTDRVWATYRALSGEAASQGATLVVWPEGTVPGRVGKNPAQIRRLTDVIAQMAGVRLLTGGRDEGDSGEIYNCAFLIDPEHGLAGRYAKVHLVPFAEFVVLRDYLPDLSSYRVLPYDVSAGRETNVLGDEKGRLGALICFESAFPQISRQLAAAGAEILCVLTNDGWFGRSAACEQHLSKSVFRAVENQRYVLRAASTGISCIVDPRGRVAGEVALQEQGTLVRDTVLIQKKSFYTRFGDWFVLACAAVTIALAAICRRRER